VYGGEAENRRAHVYPPGVMAHGVQLCFIRPGRLAENGFIDSLSGRLRNGCLNVEWFDPGGRAAKAGQVWCALLLRGAARSLADRTPAACAELHRHVTEETGTWMERVHRQSAAGRGSITRGCAEPLGYRADDRKALDRVRPAGKRSRFSGSGAPGPFPL